jgi:PAS domain S-box-containing protein
MSRGPADVVDAASSEAASGREPLARVVGDLAGVVEWANDAFARLTGIPLAETVHKPVTRFLERAGLEPEVVDFVAQHFFEGRTCRLEFPYERPDGRRLEILLEVDALRDASGEIDRFVAVARARSDEPARIDGRSAARPTARSERGQADRLGPGRSSDDGGRELASRAPGLDLSHEVERVVLDAAQRVRASASEFQLPAFDLELDPALDPIAGTRAALEGLVEALLESALQALFEAGDAWGALSVTTGRTLPNRRFVSKVHAIATGPAAWAGESRTFLEVHDTGRPLSPAALDRIRSGDLGSDPREQALARAMIWVAELGGMLVLDGTPGCGSQSLVVFPAAAIQTSAEVTTASTASPLRPAPR